MGTSFRSYFQRLAYACFTKFGVWKSVLCGENAVYLTSFSIEKRVAPDIGNFNKLVVAVGSTIPPCS